MITSFTVDIVPHKVRTVTIENILRTTFSHMNTKIDNIHVTQLNDYQIKVSYNHEQVAKMLNENRWLEYRRLGHGIGPEWSYTLIPNYIEHEEHEEICEFLITLNGDYVGERGCRYEWNEIHSSHVPKEILIKKIKNLDSSITRCKLEKKYYEGLVWTLKHTS